MAAYLTSDCLTNILSYFDSDPHSLHSFLLVNRYWCINTVPILWRRTFYLTAHGSFSSKSRCRLISTYLSCLTLNKPNSPNLDSSITITSHASSSDMTRNKQNHFSFAQQKSLTFDYVSFLRGFDYFQVYYAIGNWYANQSSEKKQSIDFIKIFGMDDDECRKFMITKELIKCILNKSPIIDYLALDSETTIPSEFTSIGKFPGATICLSYIRTFICRGSSKKLDLYIVLSKICRNVENMTIFGIGEDDSNAEGLSNLIRKQHHLRKFVLWDGTNEQMSKVIKALSDNREKMKYLEFRFCNFENCRPLESLAAACTELTTLKFIQCGEISSNITLSFSRSLFPDLHDLDLQGTHFPADTLETIFHHANINLISINIEADSNQHFRIIEKLATNCPNITKLHARLSKNGMGQLNSLFRSCKRLETIILQGHLPNRIFIFAQDANDDLLINLREVIPASLKKFVVKTDCAFTSSAVDTFLRECKADLNRLEFISYGSVWQHLNVIKRYARKHRLEIKQQIAGNYKELLMRELGHVIVEFE
ncbi:11105_t:CDS:1 [Funneliformis mosseae]|uniref:11105_t:CDS:1 n=1 Tax=Funneliformis mosseae TaxID=27381 RepID=A0A9N9FJE7_FUNMO|nr:11105_t:CDS:1 [Funneliformis mosseae]